MTDIQAAVWLEARPSSNEHSAADRHQAVKWTLHPIAKSQLRLHNGDGAR